MKDYVIYLFVLLSLCTSTISAQISSEKTAQIYIVDSYVTEKIPHNFKLYFFTDDSAKSSILIDGKYEYDISKSFDVNHKIEIEISKLQFDSLKVPFQIILKYQDGKKELSEIFEFELPYNSVELVAASPGLFKMCVGGVLFLLPSPGVVFKDGESNLSLSLELPMLSFYSNGFNYPSGYVSAGYLHHFGNDGKNYFVVGYKKIFETNFLEFISPGADMFTNFNGSNGITAEVTFGLFKLTDIFTVYTRYGYYFSFVNSTTDFQEISIGLYAHFFSINL